MGQRTQIIVVHDIVHPIKSATPSIRLVSAHHNQWGFGRPVCLDICGLVLKTICGKLSPYMFNCKTNQDVLREMENMYSMRTMLTHLCTERVIEKKKWSGILTPTREKMTAYDFTYGFDLMDNNNGGAVFWVVEDAEKRTLTMSYGCVFGPEDCDTPFAGFVDGATYIKKVNPQDYALDFIPYFENTINTFDVKLLSETDTVKTLMAKEDNE